MRHGSRRCHARLRTPRHFKNQRRRRSPERRARSAFAAKPCPRSPRSRACASKPARPGRRKNGRRKNGQQRKLDARTFRTTRHRNHPRDQRRPHGPRRRSRPARRNLHHRPRSLLQYTGAQKIPQSRIHRTFPHRVPRHSLRPGPSRKTFRIALRHQRHAGRPSRCRIQRARLSGLRQRNPRSADRSRSRSTPRTHRPAPASAVAPQRRK